MGIRIHKALGYGLTNIKTRSSKRRISITDTRFDPLGWFFSDYEDREDIWSLDGFMHYWKHHKESDFSEYNIYILELKCAHVVVGGVLR